MGGWSSVRSAGSSPAGSPWIFLVSGNDAADTLARTLIPRERFVAEMNAGAATLGLREIHFLNPTGLDEPGRASSAGDLGSRPDTSKSATRSCRRSARGPKSGCRAPATRPAAWSI